MRTVVTSRFGTMLFGICFAALLILINPVSVYGELEACGCDGTGGEYNCLGSWQSKGQSLTEDSGSTIKITCGPCSGQSGENGSAYGWSYQATPAPLDCETNECWYGSTTYLHSVYKLTGSQKDLDDFFGDYWGKKIGEEGCLYTPSDFVTIWGASSSNPNSRDGGASFGLNVKTYFSNAICATALSGYNLTIQVKVNKYNKDDQLSYIKKITHHFSGETDCGGADDRWKWNYSYYDFFTQELTEGIGCVGNLRVPPYGDYTVGQTRTILKVKVPGWATEVTSDGSLPSYMVGWYLQKDSETGNYTLVHDKGELGTDEYEFDESPSDPGIQLPIRITDPVGNTKWNYDYDPNGRILHIYNGANYSTSSKKYNYEWSDVPNSTNTKVIISYYVDNGLVRRWEKEYDANGNEVRVDDGGCSSCGGGGSTSKRVEYYQTSDYNDARFDGLLKCTYNAAGDITLYNVYDPNKTIGTNPSDPNYAYLFKPLLTQQYAVYSPQSNPVTVKLKDIVYDPNTHSSLEFIYTDNSNARCVKSFYSDNTFSNLIRKIEYENLAASLTEPTGDHYTTIYDYNGTERTSTTTFPSNNRKDVEKYENGQVIESYTHDVINDCNVNTHYNEYSYGNIVSETDARGATTEYSYSGDQMTYKRTSAAGIGIGDFNSVTETYYDYNGNRQITKETEYLSTYIDWGYGWGWYDQVKQKETIYNYQAETGYLLSQVVKSDFYNEYDCNQIAITEYQYDDFGQITRQKSPEGVVSGKHYNIAGQVESEFILADGSDINEPDTSLTLVSQTMYEYDADGRTKKVLRAKDDGTFTFDEPDAWIVTEYGYDFLSRKTSVIEDANGTNPLTTSIEYNNQGELVKTINPSGKWEKTIKDGRGLPTQNIVGYGTTNILTTTFAYDDNGNLIQQSNPDGTVWNFEYDNFDRLIKSPVLPDLKVEAFNRDMLYNMTEYLLYRAATNGVDVAEPVDYAKSIWPDPNPLLQYSDGLNGYEYARGNPVNLKDPWGLATDCGIIVKRNYDPGQVCGSTLNMGHEWIEWAGGSVGYWPKFGHIILNPDPASPRVPGLPPPCAWLTTKTNTGTLKWGTTRPGVKCKCATCNEVKSCLIHAPNPNWPDWDPGLVYNCRKFVDYALKGCCLKRSK
ncbi:MAG: hypothetical protein A2Y07_03295 [Planctomycetes bacterium GWF2_50_10]|nr:MAG: hypothetical protein A2Y07_03295 [Planctomycetes bacterium GWF2_50_10]